MPALSVGMAKGMVDETSQDVTAQGGLMGLD